MKPLPLLLLALVGNLFSAAAQTDLYTSYLPEKENATGAGVVVVPGGSFLIRCEDQEGTQVAKWFARHGVAAFVVHYRLIPTFTLRDELDDVRSAIQQVRAKSASYNISSNRLGVIGFSAGAFLAGEAAVKPPPNGRPDFQILVYGAPGGTNDPITGFNRFYFDQLGREAWNETAPTTLEQIKTAPPTFMFCTGEDRGAARRMGEYHLQLMQQGVSSEAHFFANGLHGVGFAQGDPVLGVWPDLMLNWMRTKNILALLEPLAISGTVTVGGQPLELGYVTFTPTAPISAPARTAYVFNRSGPKGGFQLPAGQGLQPGVYRIEVHQMAMKWNSVWAEPLLNRLQAKLNGGEKLTEAEIAEWKAWAAPRKYEATQPDHFSYPAKIRTIDSKNAANLEIEAR